MNSSAVARLPRAALASALKNVGFDIDPEAPSFDKAAARIVELAIGDDERWMAFRQSFDPRALAELDDDTEVDFPDQPGALVLAERQVRSDSEVVNRDPTGWERQHEESLGTVMVVDDSRIDRVFVQNECGAAGVQVRSYTNGWDALGALEDEQLRPDLLFVDVNMPRINGFELVKIIQEKERYRGAHIVMMTSDRLEDWRTEMKALHGAEFVQKPLNRSQVRRFCREHAKPQDLSASL